MADLYLGLEDLRDEVAVQLERLRHLLPEGIGEFKLTLLARVEGNPDADLIVTQEGSPGGLFEMLRRNIEGWPGAEGVVVRASLAKAGEEG